MSKDEYLITDAPLKALTVFAMPMILGSFFGSRNFVVDATFLYLVASTLNGIQNAFKWNTVISDFW